MQREQRPRIHVAHLAPIKPWVRKDNLNASNQQRKERNDREPVRYTHHRCMSRHFNSAALKGRWHGRRLAQPFFS